VHLTFRTSPERLSLAVGSSIETAPFTRTVIVGSANSVSAPTTQALAGTPYDFSSWSDGGAATHNLTAPASDASYTASYAAPPPLPVLPPFSTVPPTLSGTAREGSELTSDKGEWSGSQPLSYSVDWLRCGKDASACAVVEGAYGTTYVLSAVDVGSRIIARVTADNAVGSSMAQTSPTGVVAKHPRGPIKAVRRVPAPSRPRVLHKRPKRLR
jgi:hypothetical protein